MVSRLVLGLIAILVVAVIAAGVLLAYPPSSGTITTGPSSGSPGKLAIMGTDPYTSGAHSQPYEHYSNVAAHRTNPGGQPTTSTTSSAGGWVMLNSSGTLKLNALVNVSQTMALANVSSGVYDSIRIYVDSAIVTYNGQNYTAHMSSSMITASLKGGAQVSGSSTTAVIVDLRTVAINAGSSSSPNFAITSSARAEVVTTADVDPTSLRIGARIDLSGSPWFQSFIRGNARLQVTSAAISVLSLNVTIRNMGAENANVTLVVVTPVSILTSAQIVIPDSLQGSAVFVVGPGGSLTAVGSGSLLAQVASPGSGLSVSSSGSASLNFSGTIQFATVLGAQLGVQPGQSYLITVIGTNAVATSTVSAS